jgi:hypothetical protein
LPDTAEQAQNQESETWGDLPRTTPGKFRNSILYLKYHFLRLMAASFYFLNLCCFANGNTNDNFTIPTLHSAIPNSNFDNGYSLP